MRKPQRFLITRLSAFGDCIQTLPLLCALRDAFPDSNITWLTQDQFKPFLERHSDVDNVVSVSRRWFLSRTQIRKVWEQLRSMNFDVVLDPQSLTKSSIVGVLSGAKRRIGIDRPTGRELAPILNNELVSSCTHVIHRYLRLLHPLGVKQSQIAFRFPLSAASHKLVDFFRLAGGFGNFVVLNPNAGWPSKEWSAEQVAETAAGIHETFGLKSVVLWHGDAERQVAENVAKSHPAVLLAPPINLTELAALIHAACLFVGTDSGPLHLAAAIGTPCVGLFGSTRGDVCGPLTSNSICIHSPLLTACRRNATNTAMRAIDSETVLSACSKLMNGDRFNANPPYGSKFTALSARDSSRAA